MKKQIVLFLSILSTTLASCTQDIEIPKYDQLELPYIENPLADPSLFIRNHFYEVVYGDTLKITPAVVHNNMDDLTYEWYINEKLISQNKDLEWICNIENKAHGVFKIHRKSAGNSEILPFNITLDQPFERGWNIVVNDNGKSAYHFLREKVGNPYVYQPFEFALRTESPANTWIKPLEYWSNESTTVMGMLLHLNTNPADCFNIDQITMAPSTTLQQEFIGDQFPAEMQIKDAMYCGYVSYLLDNNKNLFYRKSQNGYFTGRYSTLPLYYEDKPLKAGHITSKMPYKCGFGLIFDEEKGRFLMVANYYEQRKASLAGKIVEFPESSSLNKMKGREIIYSRVILSPNYMMSDYSFVVVSKDITGKYRLSEYKVYLSEETLQIYQEVFTDALLEDFGPNSVITILDNPLNYGKDYFYYSSASNPNILYSARKSNTGISERNIYKTFSAPIISIDHSKPSRISANIGIATENGEFYLFSLLPNMAEYVEPTETAKQSLLFHWNNLGEIKGINYRFGKISAY